MQAGFSREMPKLKISNASIHTLRNFIFENSPFSDTESPASLVLHPKWAHMDPMTLAITAAWGGWCRKRSCTVEAQNAAGNHCNYFARMGLFQHLGVQYEADLQAHEETGRFLSLRQVRSTDELGAVIADVSALLHLDTELDALTAVRYCLSELIRNVLEHSGSLKNEQAGEFGGAYVCAQRYVNKNPKRVSIAVVDCGWGIPEHLGFQYPKAKSDHREALRLAMELGITGAYKGGMYAAPENAGAGLFFTRAIAKVTGGYFVLVSGDAAYRLRRSKGAERQRIYGNAFDERHDLWTLPSPWIGTVAAVEIATDEIPSFSKFFDWVRKQLPTQKTARGRIKFT